jgi:hypothetical protein
MTREERRRIREQYSRLYFVRDDLEDALKYLKRINHRDVRQHVFDLERIIKDISIMQRKNAELLNSH